MSETKLIPTGFLRSSYAVLAAVMGGCATTPGPEHAAEIVVSVGEGRLVAKDSSGSTVLDCDCETSRVGTGSRKYSRRTPLGSFYIAQIEPHHRYGPALRLNGYQGYTRGILIHRNLDGKPLGTSGCVSPLRQEDMDRLHQLARVGTRVTITKR